MLLRRLGLLALLVAGGMAPALAQFTPDYPKPEVIDPAWFAGVMAPATNLPVQNTGFECSSKGADYCVSVNYGWGSSKEADILRAGIVPFNAKIEQRLKKGIATNPRFQSWRMDLARFYLRAERYDLFFTEINAQIRIWYSGEESLLMRADTLALLGRYDLALIDVDAAIFWAQARKNSRLLGFIFASKAEILMRLGRNDEAMQAIRLANDARDSREFTQYSRIDWANERAFPALFGARYKEVQDALSQPVEAKCKPIPAQLIVAQKAQYRNLDSISRTLPIHEACGQWSSVVSQTQWLMEYTKRPEVKMADPQAPKLHLDALKLKAAAHMKLGQYRDAQFTLIPEMLDPYGYHIAQPIERMIAEAVLAEKAAGGTPDPYIVTELTKRIAERQAAGAQEAALDTKSARIKMCNNTSNTVRLVMRYVDLGEYSYATRGWLTISSGSCVTYRAQGGTFFLYHAVESNTYATWTGDDQICVATTFGDWIQRGNEPCTGNFELRPARSIKVENGMEYTENLN